MNPASVTTNPYVYPINFDAINFAKLPPKFLPFEEFDKEFSLGTTTTEQLHPITVHLSRTMHENVASGLQQLLEVDQKVVEGFEQFIPKIDAESEVIAKKIQAGGRVFLVGSGSSGRAAIDIAAKCNAAFPGSKGAVHGIIAGGDSAFIRPKEGFEDSEKDGREVLKSYQLKPNDTVILISASGSAPFNVGCGEYASEQGAHVLYFYNSKKIPERTQKLFLRPQNPVVPLEVDIGPQAIAGSTRLQGASLAEVCLGTLLGSSLNVAQNERETAKKFPIELIGQLREGNRILSSRLDAIAEFVKIEKKIFSDPESNFRRVTDLTRQGYITPIAKGDSIREVETDGAETSPTFSTNPIRKETEELNKKAEFRPYLVGAGDNHSAWKTTLGREVNNSDLSDTDSFVLSCEADGVHSYKSRPTGKGNFVFAVEKLDSLKSPSEELLQVLRDANLRGGHTGIILLYRGKVPEGLEDELRHICDTVLILENIPRDPLGLVETIVLKQALHLISNGSMVLMNKIFGNQMIDVRASNNKLRDRCIRLIKSIWKTFKSAMLLENIDLYHYVAHVSAIKDAYQKVGIYTPGIVKIVLTMLALKKQIGDFQAVVDLLKEKNEDISWIKA